jgi:outer membrane protein OmpA-like peptidoglycan-associated protein
VGTLLSLFLVPAFATSSVAQVIIGDGVRPQVEVDTAVLDRLGKEPTLPDLFLGGSASTPSAESRGEQTPELSQPQHRIVLKKPVHKTAKPKPTVAAAKKTAPATVAAPAPATAMTAPEPKVVAKPAETPTVPAPQNNLPSVSLPAIAATEPQPASSSESKSDVKSETKAEGPIASASKAEPQPESAPVAKLPVTPAAAPIDKPTTAAAPPQPLTPSAAPQATATATPPAPTPAPAPEPSTPAPTAKTTAPLPTVTVPSMPTAIPEQQEAHLPAATSTNTAAPVSGIEPPLAILFEKDGARLPDSVHASLSQLADRLSADATLQIQILAYAEGDEDNASKARRLSLSRALAVRSVLIDQGVRSTRIEVRALGNKVPEGPPDRVDILLQRR